jgi:hypothetical protein
MSGDHQLPFGKHRGKPPSAVPSDYLSWLLRTVKLSTGLRAAVRGELVSRGVALPPEPPPPPEPSCQRCGKVPLVYGWAQDRNGNRRIRRECSRCGAWLGVAPLVPEYIARADANASPAPVLDVLTRCEELGISLQSDGSRVDFAGDGWRKATPELRRTVKQCSHLLAGLLGKTART